MWQYGTIERVAKQIEVSLKIPQNRKNPLLQEGYPIDMAMVRFRKAMNVEAIPRPGEVLQLSAANETLRATVVRADWSDAKGLFVVTCQYGLRSIPNHEQDALVADPDWRLEPLI